MLEDIKQKIHGFEKIFCDIDLSEQEILDQLINLRKKFCTTEEQFHTFKILIENYSENLKSTNKNFFFNDYDKLEFFKLINQENKLFRYINYRFKYITYPLHKKIDSFPPCIQIEPSSICNFRCVMCFQTDKTFSSDKKEHMGLMKFDLFKKVIDQITGKIEAVTFASRGEPTLNKNFSKFLSYCKDKFVALKVNTNLSTLTEELAKSIFENDCQTLVISADAADKKNYERIRVKGKFEKILKNLQLLSNIKKDYPNSRTIIRVSGVKFDDKQDFEAMKKTYSKYVDSIAFVNYLPWESSYDNKINNIEEPCSDLWRRVFIWYDGKINPCDYDYKSKLSKHNIKDFTIDEVWNSSYYNSLREKHLQKKRNLIFPCNRCNNI
jgi:radical SAM protein with 4Fe4S-binding SPASM domain